MDLCGVILAFSFLSDAGGAGEDGVDDGRDGCIGWGCVSLWNIAANSSDDDLTVAEGF